MATSIFPPKAAQKNQKSKIGIITWISHHQSIDNGLLGSHKKFQPDWRPNSEFQWEFQNLAADFFEHFSNSKLSAKLSSTLILKISCVLYAKAPIEIGPCLSILEFFGHKLDILAYIDLQIAEKM